MQPLRFNLLGISPDEGEEMQIQGNVFLRTRCWKCQMCHIHFYQFCLRRLRRIACLSFHMRIATMPLFPNQFSMELVILAVCRWQVPPPHVKCMRNERQRIEFSLTFLPCRSRRRLRLRCLSLTGLQFTADGRTSAPVLTCTTDSDKS